MGNLHSRRDHPDRHLHGRLSSLYPSRAGGGNVDHRLRPVDACHRLRPGCGRKSGVGAGVHLHSPAHLALLLDRLWFRRLGASGLVPARAATICPPSSRSASSSPWRSASSLSSRRIRGCRQSSSSSTVARCSPAPVPFLFITIACGDFSGFHALISSGTTPKMLENETHAHFIGYGGMLTE